MADAAPQEFKYHISDPKTGGTFDFTAPRELSNEEIQRTIDKTFNRPTPEMPEGAGTGGSTGLEIAKTVGKAILREAPGIALSAALPAAVPLAGGASIAARAGLAVAGQEIGQTVGTFGTEGRLPTATEAVIGGVSAALPQLGVDAAGKLLFGQQTKQELANALLQETRFSKAAAAGDTTLAGQFVKDVLPTANRRIKQAVRAKYGAVQAAASGLPPLPIPNDLINSAREAQDAIGAAADSLVPAQQSKTRSILQRIVDRGEPKQIKARTVPRTRRDYTGMEVTEELTIPGRVVQPKPVTFKELTKMKRELEEVLPSYQNSLNPDTYTMGILTNIHSRIDELMTGMTRGTPAEPLLKEARDYFKREVVPFREGMNSVLRDSVGPTDVIDTLVRAGQPDRLNAIYKHVSPETRNVLSSSWFSKTIQEATDPRTGVINPKTLLKTWDNLGPKAQNIIVGGKRQQVNTIFDELATIANRDALVGHSSAIFRGGATVAASGYALVQAINAFESGDITKGLRSIAIGAAAPLILPKILSDPKVINYMANGLALPQKTNIAVRHGRLIAQTLRSVATTLTGLSEPEGINTTNPPSIP